MIDYLVHRSRNPCTTKLESLGQVVKVYMDYFEAKSYIEASLSKGIMLGLDRMKIFMDYLSNPQERLRCIHVAGTNGKGSVCTMISAALIESGLTIGMYSSPQIENARDHFRINGEVITREDYAEAVSILKAAAFRMTEDGFESPTAFELETALAFVLFDIKGCDICVIEVGLGGALDATNIISNPLACVISRVSFDHMGMLGTSLYEIASNKAGIIKDKAKVVLALQEEEAFRAIEEKINQTDASYVMVDEREISDILFSYPTQSFSYKHFKNLELSLMGTYQISNAACAVEALLSIEDEIKAIIADKKLENRTIEDYIRSGFRHAKWPCRFEEISDNPTILLDGAHNEDAACRLADSIRTYFQKRKIIYIMGVLKDKEYEKICSITCKLASYVYTVSTSMNGRGLSAEALLSTVSKYNENAKACDSYETAVEAALDKAEEYKKDSPVILVFGSLSYLNEIRQLLKDKRVRNNL